MICSMWIKYKKSNAFTSEFILKHLICIDMKHLTITRIAPKNSHLTKYGVIYWLAAENIPLSKYDSFLTICKLLGIPRMEPLSIGGLSRVNYCSYYAAN